jgi:ABC-2 type transport system permease protein
VFAFDTIAVDGITIASPEISSVTTPLNVQQSELSGSSTPSATYAAAIASAVLVMFVAVLLGAGMLALERSENAFSRLVPVIVAPRELLTEKLTLAAGCAFAMTLATDAVLSIVAPLELSRLPLWLAAIALAAAAFGALGLAVGAIAHDLSFASLLAFLISLPVAFIALVPRTVVSSSITDLFDVISFVFPFRATLDALTGAFNAGGPTLALPLVHLAALAVAFYAIGRLALGRV